MANATGADSDLVSLATLAGQYSVALYKTVGSYQSPQQRVCDLVEETSALADVLQSLTDAARANTESQNPALAIPLERCAWACQQFEQEIKRFSRSDDGGTSSCDWRKLRYMGENVDGFRRLLSGYRIIISIALTIASVQRSQLIADDIKYYTQLLSAAKADLESRLEMMDELDNIPGQYLTGSDSGQIEKERQSAEQCLRICAQFSEHIVMARLANENRSPRSNNKSNINLSSVSEESTSDELQKLKELSSRMKAYLASNEKQQFDRLVEKATTTSSTSAAATAEITAEFARLRDEWQLGRELIDELSSKTTKLEMEMTLGVFQNHGTGDVRQFMVSTEGNPLRGRNEGSGWKIRQLGGYAADETVRQVSKDMSYIFFPSAKTSEEFSGSAESYAEPKPDVKLLRRTNKQRLA